MKLHSLLAPALTVAGIAAIVVLLIVADRCTNRPEDAEEHALEDFQTAMAGAKEAGNCVVSCRENLGKPGLNTTKAHKQWNIISNEYDENQLVRDGTKAIVIFVHGYNVGWPSAISCGNILLARLRKSAMRTAANQILTEQPLAHVSFFTFCWRGDLGSDRFDKAEKAADDLAPICSASLSRRDVYLRPERC